MCPANCIKLVPGEDEHGNRYPLIYEIDEFRCVFCGYCQVVCPEVAIHVGVHYENSEYSRDRFVYDLERLQAQTHPVSTLCRTPAADLAGPVKVTTITAVIFYVFGAWAIVSAFLCISRSNALSSALWLVSTMFALAAMFVILDAQFIAAIQVLVYAGAVMVLFLFVIMLLNLEVVPHDWKRWPVWLIGAGVAGVLGATLASMHSYTPDRLAREVSNLPRAVTAAMVFPVEDSTVVAAQGAVGRVAQPLFQTYLIPFEITSVLLLAAVIGAVVLAKKKL